jgi:predicted dehydrogenase
VAVPVAHGRPTPRQYRGCWACPATERQRWRARASRFVRSSSYWCASDISASANELRAGATTLAVMRAGKEDSAVNETSSAATADASSTRIRIGIVGSGYMAKAHSRAYLTLSSVYGPKVPRVELVRLADVTEELAQAGARRYGWADATEDWRRITRASDIDLVDIVTPNDLHAEIALDAAEHGKHIICEKPLAIDAASAHAVYSAAERAGVSHQVNFVFRRMPAVQYAKHLIDAGELGRVLHVRAQYFHQYGLDPSLPRTWRFERSRAGGGALADLGSHAIDMARYLAGDVDKVIARMRTFIGERPAPSTGTSFLEAADNGHAQLESVDVDDATDAMLEFTNGAIGVLQANWTAAGHNNHLAVEVGGERGRIQFSWNRPNELGLFLREDAPGVRGERTIVTGPAHPEFGSFAQLPGVHLGQADAMLISLREIVDAAARRRQARPSFEDGVRVCEVTEAIQQSANAGTWVQVQRRGDGHAPSDRSAGADPADPMSAGTVRA